jgi:hypothetical protein
MIQRETTAKSNDSGLLILGALLGAGLMFLLDPDRGRRRRARLRDKLIHGVHEAEHLGEVTASSARHIRNQARGALAETRARMHTETVDDAVLEGRLRAELGRLVQPVGDIRAEVDNGMVRLTGTIEPGNEERIIDGIRRVPGVRSVQNQLVGRTKSEV